MDTHTTTNSGRKDARENRVRSLLAAMSLAEKIGQLNQLHGGDDPLNTLAEAVRAGRVGSIINTVDAVAIAELQRIATDESSQGIPLLVARDVIHGFSLIAPIPLGQAAAFDPELVERCARMAAVEATAVGINWTFAPMLDIARDARWGRIAESLGEDPLLASQLGAAMVRGFQGMDLSDPTSLAACAKHFVGYGAVEGGRDYATTLIPVNELHNIYLPPFRAAVDAGVATIMTSFCDLDGVPATAKGELLNDLLRGEWAFEGTVISDWESVSQLVSHGIAENTADAAAQALTAGVDIDMASESFARYLAQLVDDGVIAESCIDQAVERVLRLKASMGFFDAPSDQAPNINAPISEDEKLATVLEAARKSVVLLKNDDGVLPLAAPDLTSIAVIGPLADAAHDQLGTWVFDGDTGKSVTCLQALRHDLEGQAELHYVRGLETSRSRDASEFDEVARIATAADVAVLFLGEEAILSGEAHCRADIDLPGAQEALLRRVADTGTPVVAVILAGRPLTLGPVLPYCSAVLYAWHPGSLAGPALSDLLLGRLSPSGKLPVSFPRMVGQIPIHYNHKRGGKPASHDSVMHIDDIPPLAPQTSLGMTSFHLDAGFEPEFPFGFGLSYTTFEYSDLTLDRDELCCRESLEASVTLTNTGAMAAEEVVQLYIRDRVGSVTRPVRELKDFRRVALNKGESQRLTFTVHSDQLRFFGRNNHEVLEPGDFHLWICGSSATGDHTSFRLTPALS